MQCSLAGLGGIEGAVARLDEASTRERHWSRVSELLAEKARSAEPPSQDEAVARIDRTARRAGRGIPPRARLAEGRATCTEFRNGFPDLRLNRGDSRQATDTSLLALVHRHHDRHPDGVHADDGRGHHQERRPHRPDPARARSLQAEAEDRARRPTCRCWPTCACATTELEEAIRSARMEMILLTDEAQQPAATAWTSRRRRSRASKVKRLRARRKTCA